jgi:hypothetical protein
MGYQSSGIIPSRIGWPDIRHTWQGWVLQTSGVNNHCLHFITRMAPKKSSNSSNQEFDQCNPWPEDVMSSLQDCSA